MSDRAKYLTLALSLCRVAIAILVAVIAGIFERPFLAVTVDLTPVILICLGGTVVHGMRHALDSWPIGPSPQPAVRPPAEAMPSQVWRLFHQHQPSFGASLRSFPSRPVPPETHSAGVRESDVPSGLVRREPMVMKQRPRSRISGCWSTQCR